MMVLAIAMMALYRSAIEGIGVLDWFQGGLVVGFVGLAMWQISNRGKAVLADVPNYVWMMGLAGASLPLPLALTACCAAALIYLGQRIFTQEKYSVACFGFAIHCTILLYATSVITLP